MLSFYRPQTRWFLGSKFRSGVLDVGLPAPDNVICRKLGADVESQLFAAGSLSVKHSPHTSIFL